MCDYVYCYYTSICYCRWKSGSKTEGWSGETARNVNCWRQAEVESRLCPTATTRTPTWVTRPTSAGRRTRTKTTRRSASRDDCRLRVTYYQTYSYHSFNQELLPPWVLFFSVIFKPDFFFVVLAIIFWFLVHNSAFVVSTSNSTSSFFLISNTAFSRFFYNHWIVGKLLLPT